MTSISLRPTTSTATILGSLPADPALIDEERRFAATYEQLQPCPNVGKPVSNLDVQQLSNDYFARVHRAALVLTGNPWDADDLTQETFLTHGVGSAV